MVKRSSTPLEESLRDNVRRLLDDQYGGVVNRLIKKHKNVGLSRLQDILGGGGCTVAKLGPLADAFGLKPYQLLIPGLNVKKPQVIVSARQARALKMANDEEDDDEANPDRARDSRNAPEAGRSAAQRSRA